MLPQMCRHFLWFSTIGAQKSFITHLRCVHGCLVSSLRPVFLFCGGHDKISSSRIFLLNFLYFHLLFPHLVFGQYLRVLIINGVVVILLLWLCGSDFLWVSFSQMVHWICSLPSLCFLRSDFLWLTWSHLPHKIPSVVFYRYWSRWYS